MRRHIALSIYAVIGLIDLYFGVTYLTSSEFLSYHSQAVSATWQEVAPGFQTLILALMKVAGGGFCATGLFMLALVLVDLRQRGPLARLALPGAALLLYVPTFAATWSVYRETGAQSPWIASLAAIVFVLIAMALYVPWRMDKPARET